MKTFILAAMMSIGFIPQVSGLVNLLHADNPSYREFVYDYIHANKIHEPRYFEIVGADVLAFASAPAAEQRPTRLVV